MSARISSALSVFNKSISTALVPFFFLFLLIAEVDSVGVAAGVSLSERIPQSSKRSVSSKEKSIGNSLLLIS